jgi:cell division septation protein DedD
MLVAAALLPIVSARAQDTGRVKASQLVKSVVLINTFACDTQPVPGQAVPVPYQDQRCDAAAWKGSGSVIDAQGHILTNDHVIRPDRHGSGVDPNRLGWYLIYQTLDSKELPVALFYARVIASDQDLDLAILEPAWGLDGQPIEPGSIDNTLPVLPVAKNPGTVDLEDTLRLLGYPRAHPLVTASTVNVVGFETDAHVPELGNTAWIRTDVAAAGPGNSGGPAVNDAGEQVGVVSAGSRNDLDCQDYNGDGKVDPVSECVTAAGGSEYVRPIPEAYELLIQEGQATEPVPTPTTEAPPEPPEETPTATTEAPPPPVEATETPTEAPTQAPEPTSTPEQQPPDTSAGTAIIIGTLVSADTGDPIPRAQVVVLQPGVSVKDWKRGNVGNEAIYTYALTDARGNFQLPEPVERNVGYGIWLQAKGYEELFKDDKILATEDDPAIVDLGVIEMPVQV